jgi:hypothetical protein
MDMKGTFTINVRSKYQFRSACDITFNHFDCMKINYLYRQLKLCYCGSCLHKTSLFV